MRPFLLIIVAAVAVACPFITAALAQETATVVYDDGRPSETIPVAKLDP